MKKTFVYVGYIFIILIFLLFNYIILNSLREEKRTEESLKTKIVLISHIYSNPYWQYIKLGAEQAAQERNAVIDYQGPGSASIEEGIKFINMAYASKASGIITYVQDEDRYINVINKVASGGIPIITVDSDAEKSKRLAYVGTDNIAAGNVAGKEMISQIGIEGNVAIIMGGRNVKNQVERVKGFSDYLSQNSNLIIKDIQSSDAYLLEAELAAKKIILNNWDIRALFCTSALDGEGAAKALNTLGLAGKVKIVCFDDLPETMESIKNGVITSTIVQKPYDMGYKAVNIIMDIMEGKERDGIFLTDVIVIRKENTEKFESERGDYNSDDK